MTQLSKHFTLEELTYSPNAIRRGIKNTPNAKQKANLKLLCDNILESVRELADEPVHVSSGFRNREVNELAGGVKDSDHMSGTVADIQTAKLTPRELFDRIRKSDIKFDQLICEFGVWNHISYRAISPRGECLIASKNRAGKTVYKKINRYAK